MYFYEKQKIAVFFWKPLAEKESRFSKVYAIFYFSQSKKFLFWLLLGLNSD